MKTMRGHFRCAIWTLIACVGASLSVRSVRAQWLREPMAGAPRTADGKINMIGPVPMLNGKPDLSGIWQVQGELDRPTPSDPATWQTLPAPGRLPPAPLRERPRRCGSPGKRAEFQRNYPPLHPSLPL